MTDPADTFNPGQRRLRWTLALALGFLLVAMLANFGYTVWSDRNDRVREAEKTTRNLAQVIEEQTRSMLDAAEFSLSSAARRLERIPAGERAATPAAQEVLRDNLRAMPFGRALFLLDAEGRLAHDSESFPVAATSYADREFFKVHRDGGLRDLFIGPPGAGNGVGDGFIAISRRLEHADGSFAGVAVVAVDPQYLRNFYHQIDVGVSGSIGLFLRDGRLLVRSAPTSSTTRTEFANTELFSRLLPQSPVGTYVSSTALDNVQRIVSYRVVPSRPLLVAVGLGRDEVLSHWVAKAWVYAVIALALVAFVTRLTFLMFHELAQRDHLTRVLHGSEQDLSITLQSIGDAVVATDADGRITRMNAVAERMIGITLAESLGQPLAAVFHIVNTDTGAPAVDPVQRVLAHGQAEALANHTTLLALDGREMQIANSAAPIRDSAGALRGVVLVFSDVTQQYRAQQALQASETELRISAIAFQTQEMIVITDAERNIVRANDAFIRASGFSSEDLVGRPVAMLHAPTAGRDESFYDALRETVRREGSWHGEVRCLRKDGRDFPARLTVTVVADAARQVTHFVNVLSDITKDKESALSIHRLAFYDPLTQLPNRSLLRDRLQQALARSARDQHHGALLFLDLDHFKVLNDTRGHSVGDLLLVEVARRLRSCVRASDSVARLGGDEFILLLGDLSPDPEQAPLAARELGRKVLDSLHQPFELPDFAHHSSASIGIAVFRGDAIGVDELLQQADLAMYQAKAGGRNALRFFDIGMQQALQLRVALEADLRAGLLRDELLLHYQPVVQGAGRVTGAEALVRWQHPTRGQVPPGEFIGLAETTGLIVPLGQWVLQAACAQLAAWAQQPALAPLSLAVNVSAHQFREADFVAKVLQALETSGADPQRLKLELTETLLAHDVEDIIVKMDALRARGVSFSLDDFGTGYSSLSYLKRLPLGQLKIDQSFVRDVLDDPNDAAIARTIVLLAHSLGLDVVAEGVETEGQRRFLADNGCNAYQGYLFSRPLPVGAFEAFARDRA